MKLPRSPSKVTKVVTASVSWLLSTPVASNALASEDDLQCDVVGHADDDYPPNASVIQMLRVAIKARDQSTIDDLMWFELSPVLVAHTKFEKGAKQANLNFRLVAAAARGDDPAVGRLVAEKADVNVVPDTDDFMPPIIWATRCSHLSTVKLLIAKGADVNIQGHYDVDIGTWFGVTALWWAEAYEEDDIAHLLKMNGAKRPPTPFLKTPSQIRSDGGLQREVEPSLSDRENQSLRRGDE